MPLGQPYAGKEDVGTGLDHLGLEGRRGTLKTQAHIEKVIAAAQSGSGPARSRLVASWRRSLDKHGLDPGQGDAVQRIEETEFVQHRDRAHRLLEVARAQMDQLFRLVGHSGCTVLLTDAAGVVLDQRCADGDANTFRSWGLWQGADWSEGAEGTNGVGTCLAEQRQVTIHRDEHFKARNSVMSCMDAPIFGSEGELVGALDVSSARADQTEGFNHLIAAMVAKTAAQIEAGAFRSAFPKARILLADSDEDGVKLLAVDKNDIVIGATRGARKAFGLTSAGPLTARPASDLFGREDGPSGFEKAERAAVIRALARADGNVSQAARALGIGRATLYRRMKRLKIGESPH